MSISQSLQQLIDQLRLTHLDQDVFIGASVDLGLPQIFGGQIIGQALSASQQTISDRRFANSLHGHFLQPGNPTLPIQYQVARLRDGMTFTSRQVTAWQQDKLLASFLISFHIDEVGLSHQIRMPDVAAPESLTSEYQQSQSLLKNVSQRWQQRFSSTPAIEFRPVTFHNPFSGQPDEPYRQVWLRANGQLSDDRALHQQLLAYASDFHFIPTALQPHGIGFLQPGIQVVSLNHSLCFHHACRLDQWLLYAVDSPISSNACGFVRGQFFDQTGKLVASSHQEGLLRQYST